VVEEDDRRHGELARHCRLRFGWHLSPRQTTARGLALHPPHRTSISSSAIRGSTPSLPLTARAAW